MSDCVQQIFKKSHVLDWASVVIVCTSRRDCVRFFKIVALLLMLRLLIGEEKLSDSTMHVLPDFLLSCPLLSVQLRDIPLNTFSFQRSLSLPWRGQQCWSTKMVTFQNRPLVKVDCHAEMSKKQKEKGSDSCRWGNGPRPLSALS